jgi:hypothetical protein
MYLDSLSFIEDERESWRPFEALLDLPDDVFEAPVAAAHGWSARDLASHLVAWQEYALAAARDLAMNTTSPTIARVDEEWEAGGDAMNARLAAEWAALSNDEVRRRLREVPGELRGYLTVVPETRWVKDSKTLRYFEVETLAHYQDHQADLEAILAAAGR